MIKLIEKKTIGLKLRAFYNAKGITQVSVADHCKISRVTVHRFFNGQTELKTTDFINVLSMIGIDISGKIDFLMKEEFKYE